MSINLESNAYVRVVKEKTDLSDNSKIFDHVRAGLQFKYVDVSIQDFNQKYWARNWLGRKIIALPAAVWSGTIKTIYHLVKTIFVGLIVHSGDSNYLKARFFYIVRNLQESFGWLVVLLNDRYGRYHIQESRFHKSCYDCFLNKSILKSNTFQQSSHTIPQTTPFQKKTPILSNRLSEKQSVISKMMEDPSSFTTLSYNLKKDEDVVAAALSGCKSDNEAENVINYADFSVKSSKKVALALVKIAPMQFEKLGHSAKDDEDVVVTALDGCKNAEEAKNVIRHANLNARNSKKVALALVKRAPMQFEKLGYSAKDDEDVVVTVLDGCKNAEEAENVIWHANLNARNSKKVALTLVKIFPMQFKKLGYGVKKDEDVVVTALDGCKNAEEAENVIWHADWNTKSSKKVALSLVKIAPNLLKELDDCLKSDLHVVLLAIESSTKKTIHEIWDSLKVDMTGNNQVKAKVKEKYPDFFQKQTFECRQPQGFSSFNGTSFSNSKFPEYKPFDGFSSEYKPFGGFSSFNGKNFSNSRFSENKRPHESSSSNAKSFSKQAPKVAPSTNWSEPDDLKGNTSKGANIVRKILKQNFLLSVDLIRTEVTEETAKKILCHLLELNTVISDKDLKKAYHTAVLHIHPDKLDLKSGEEAFKVLNAAYSQAKL